MNGRGKRSQKLAELKAIDSAVSAAVDTTGVRILLNGAEPGPALNQRIGRHIHMNYIDMRFFLAATATTGIDQFVRYLVVLDKQPNGAALAITDVLDSVNPFSLPNLANSERFIILDDRSRLVNASAEPGSQWGVSKRLQIGKDVTYNSGSAGTIADISTNSLYLILLGNVAAGATAATGYGNVRLRFDDV